MPHQLMAGSRPRFLRLDRVRDICPELSMNKRAEEKNKKEAKVKEANQKHFCSQFVSKVLTPSTVFLPSADCCSHSGYVTQTSVWFITSCTCLLLRFNVQTWLKCNAFLPECRHISKSLAGTLMDSAGSLSLNLFISFWYSTSGTFRPCLMLLDRSYYTWRGSHESGSCFQTSTSSVLVLRHLWHTIWHHHDTHPPTSNMLYGKQSSHWWQFKRWNFLFSILFMFERTIQIYTLMKSCLYFALNADTTSTIQTGDFKGTAFNELYRLYPFDQAGNWLGMTNDI